MRDQLTSPAIAELNAPTRIGSGDGLAPESVLFARSDSIYKTMPGCDVWDAERDALNWQGGNPVVAHPPCRLWGALSALSTAPVEEKLLAIWAVKQVRKFGGVLEHPAKSKLWPAEKLPLPGRRDKWGFTISVAQYWWGHKAEKLTWLYICGCEPSDVPPTPYCIGESTHVIAQSSRRQKLRLRPEVTKSEREHTPPALAAWLVELARGCATASNEKS